MRPMPGAAACEAAGFSGSQSEVVVDSRGFSVTFSCFEVSFSCFEVCFSCFEVLGSLFRPKSQLLAVLELLEVF